MQCGPACDATCLADLGILDDTLIYYIIGDNGASAEGTPIGTFHEQGPAEAPDLMTPEFLIERIDDFGTLRRPFLRQPVSPDRNWSMACNRSRSRA